MSSLSDFPVEKPEQYLILYIATLIQLSECLDIKPPSNASPPPTIKPVPKVVPITPTVAETPIKPPALPTTSGESNLDNFSLDESSTGNSILVFLFVLIYSKDSS